MPGNLFHLLIFPIKQNQDATVFEAQFIHALTEHLMIPELMLGIRPPITVVMDGGATVSTAAARIDSDRDPGPY